MLHRRSKTFPPNTIILHSPTHGQCVKPCTLCISLQHYASGVSNNPSNFSSFAHGAALALPKKGTPQVFGNCICYGSGIANTLTKRLTMAGKSYVRFAKCYIGVAKHFFMVTHRYTHVLCTRLPNCCVGVANISPNPLMVHRLMYNLSKMLFRCSKHFLTILNRHTHFKYTGFPKCFIGVANISPNAKANALLLHKLSEMLLRCSKHFLQMLHRHRHFQCIGCPNCCISIVNISPYTKTLQRETCC